MGFSMQSNRKTREGSDHPDRDAQFRYINETVADALAAKQAVISVDTKKKELVGEFENGGREWATKGKPVEVNTHDFPSHAQGKATPYGVYDMGLNEGWVSVGISADTARSRRRRSARGGSIWVRAATRTRRSSRSPPTRAGLTARADGCGRSSCGSLADRIGIPMRVLHYPPGTSKWNRIEHRLFSFITHQLARQAADQLPGDHQPDQPPRPRAPA